MYLKPDETRRKISESGRPQIISSPVPKCMSRKRRVPVEVPPRPLVLKSVALFQERLPASFLTSYLQEKMVRPVTDQEANM